MSTVFDYIPQVLDRAVEDAQPIDVKGKVIQVVGTIIKASVPGVKIGEVCILRNPWDGTEVQSEVVGFTKEAVLLTALGAMIGISGETEVIPTRRVQMVPVGKNLLGRVLDGLGRPMDAETKGPLRPDGYYPVYAPPPSPLERRVISKPISLGIRAIDGLLTCGEGQRMGVFAAAGGGKSTLARIIARLIDCDGGEIFLCGEDITHATGNAFYKNMQMIFQTPDDSFNPRRTLGESIAEPIKNFIGNDNLRGRVESLLVEVGLPKNYAERYPREVSGGECQRAAIARAISISPKLLICDEATSALDVTTAAQVVALIKKLCTEKNIACLFITHDLALIKKIADRVLVLEDGRLKTLDESNFKEVLQWSD